MSDIRNKWLRNPFKNWSVQCGHFCIYLCKPDLSETKSNLETISVSSVWPSRKEIVACLLMGPLQGGVIGGDCESVISGKIRKSDFG